MLSEIRREFSSSPPAAGSTLAGIEQSPVEGDNSVLRRYSILIIEDNDGDVFVIQEAIREHQIRCQVTVLATGEAAFDYFEQLETNPERSCPDLVLLDLNLPKRSGHQVLERIRSGPRCPFVPVLIVTSSESSGDLAANQRLGATAYFQKPSKLEEYMKLGAVMKSLLAGRT